MLNKIKDFFGFYDEEAEDKQTEIKSPRLKPFKGSLMDNSTTKPFASSEIKLLEPRIYEDSLTIAAKLRANCPVIVNLKYLDSDSGKRLIDFICGTAYAINGHMLKIGENIFLFTPANISISSSDEKTPFEQGVENDEKSVFFKKVASN